MRKGNITAPMNSSCVASCRLARLPRSEIRDSMLAVRGVGSAASTDELAGWGLVRPSDELPPPAVEAEEELVVAAEQKQPPVQPAPSPTTAAPQRTATRISDDAPMTPPPAASAKVSAGAAASSSVIDAKTEPAEAAAEPAAPDESTPASPSAALTPPRAAGPRCTCSRASWIYGGETGLSCDGPGCGRSFKSGETRYSCETCDFDLCAGCAEKMGVGVNSASKKRRR